MLELWRALSLAGTAVSETQDRLTTIAAASGARDARIVVLPTALMIEPLGAVVSIALGVLCGVTVFRAIETAPARLRPLATRAHHRG